LIRNVYLEYSIVFEKINFLEILCFSNGYWGRVIEFLCSSGCCIVISLLLEL